LVIDLEARQGDKAEMMDNEKITYHCRYYDCGNELDDENEEYCQSCRERLTPEAICPCCKMECKYCEEKRSRALFIHRMVSGYDSPIPENK